MKKMKHIIKNASRSLGRSCSILGLFLTIMCGCHSGSMTRFEQRSVAGVTSLTFGEYLIPVFSIATGPSLDVWQTKDLPSKIEFEGTAVTTNQTSALGMYESTERKIMRFKGTWEICSTNKNGVVED